MPRAPSLELCVLPSGGGQPYEPRVDRVSPLELYVLPKETGTQIVSAQPEFQVACQSGAEGSRTPDLLGAIQALSQLSYSPARAGTGERGGSLAPGPPEDNSPAHVRGAAFKLLNPNSFGASRQANPVSTRCPDEDPSRVKNCSFTRVVSDSFQYLPTRAMGGDPTTFVVSQTAHTPPGVVPPPLQLPRACNGARGP